MGDLIPSGERYTIVRPIFSFSLGRTYRVFGPDGGLAMYAEQPWFQLRQELIVYGDEQQLQPLFVIRNRRIAGFSMEHDVLDAMTGARLGSLRTRGLRFLWRDAWDILGPDDRPAGLMEEEGNALLRRVFRFLAGRHRIELGGREVARVQQIFHVFRREFVLEILQQDDPIEPRFAVACALIAILADLRREQRD
jgi:hypothetical protein